MSNDAEHWRIRALTAEHLLEHERAEIERLLDYAAELEEKLGETEQESMSMTGRFLVVGSDVGTPMPEWVEKAPAPLDDALDIRRSAEADRALFEEFMRGDQWSPPLRARSEYREPKGTAAPPAKNKHHAQFTRETWRK